MGFSNDAIGGTTLVRQAIQSPNYAAGASGWTVNQNGSAEFNSLTLRGTFDGTDYIINSAGAFFYAGTPAAGNLAISIAPASGTDSFGNAYPAGIGLLGSASNSQLVWPNATANLYQLGVLSGGTTYLVLGGNSGSGGKSAWISAGGVVLAQNPGSLTPEIWHTLAAGSSWAGTVSYRLTPENEVQISAALTAPAASVNGVTIVTLPAAYRPAGSHTVPAVASVLNGAATGDGRITLATSGTLQSSGIGASASVNIDARIPLDI